MNTIKEWLDAIDGPASALVFADWLEERSDPRAQNVREWVKKQADNRSKWEWDGNDLIEAMAPTALADGAWNEVFAFAGSEKGCNTAVPERALPNDDVSVAPFSRADVAEVTACVEGENDEDNWLVAGRLFDGRWFFLDAGCDYTGWD